MDRYYYYFEQEIAFDNSVSFIIGPIGSGKTIILRAINYLKDFKGFSRNKFGLFYDSKNYYPNLKFYLNPNFFGLSSKSGLIIVEIFPDHFNIKSQHNDITSEEIRDLIKNKLEIICINLGNFEGLGELYKTHPRLYKYSLSERSFEIFKIKTKDLRNKLILIDDIFLTLTEEKKELFFEEIKQLGKYNQVIVSSHTPIFKNLQVQTIILRGEVLQLTIDNYFSPSFTSEYYKEFLQSISNIRQLIEIEISDKNLKKPFFRLLFANVITIMESYLSDTFIRKVTSKKKIMERLLNTKLYNQEKKKLPDAYKWISKMKVNITEDLLKIQFHNLWKVKELYKEVLEIELPEVTEKLINSVFIRHDIVHNNGKTKKKGEWIINKDQINQLIDDTEELVKSIENQLIS